MRWARGLGTEARCAHGRAAGDGGFFFSLLQRPKCGCLLSGGGEFGRGPAACGSSGSHHTQTLPKPHYALADREQAPLISSHGVNIWSSYCKLKSTDGATIQFGSIRENSAQFAAVDVPAFMPRSGTYIIRETEGGRCR